MKVKKAIEIIDKYEIELPIGDAKKIIDLLKRGEKFEQMWKDLKNNFPYLRGELEVKEFIEEFEQKYFPKI